MKAAIRARVSCARMQSGLRNRSSGAINSAAPEKASDWSKTKSVTVMTDSPPAIRTEALSFDYGRQPVLRDVALSVPAGCVYGYLGRNGAGKTTTIKLLLGLLKIQSGRARVLGLDPGRDSIRKRAPRA